MPTSNKITTCRICGQEIAVFALVCENCKIPNPGLHQITPGFVTAGVSLGLFFSAFQGPQTCWMANLAAYGLLFAIFIAFVLGFLRMYESTLVNTKAAYWFGLSAFFVIGAAFALKVSQILGIL